MMVKASIKRPNLGMILRVIFVALLMWGCNPGKYVGTETQEIIVRDTVLIETVKTDTLIELQELKDTLIITRDKLTIKTITVNDSIYIYGKCEGDTVYLEKIITVEKKVFRPLTWWEKNRAWLIGLIVAMVIGVLIKKIGLI